MKNKDKHCHYSGLPSPAAYEQKTSKMKLINKYYPIGIAFVCLLYSVSLGLLGYTEEAQYSAHWPGTILLFSIAMHQINKS